LVSSGALSERQREHAFVELLPKQIPYLCFDLEPMVGVAVFFLAFGLFTIELWLSVVRDYLNFLLIRDLGLYAWRAFPFGAARHGLDAVMDM
jgi:hypothetical protein